MAYSKNSSQKNPLSKKITFYNSESDDDERSKSKYKKIKTATVTILKETRSKIKISPCNIKSCLVETKGDDTNFRFVAGDEPETKSLITSIPLSRLSTKARPVPTPMPPPRPRPQPPPVPRPRPRPQPPPEPMLPLLPANLKIPKKHKSSDEREKHENKSRPHLPLPAPPERVKYNNTPIVTKIKIKDAETEMPKVIMKNLITQTNDVTIISDEDKEILRLIKRSNITRRDLQNLINVEDVNNNSREQNRNQPPTYVTQTSQTEDIVVLPQGTVGANENENKALDFSNRNKAHINKLYSKPVPTNGSGLRNETVVGVLSSITGEYLRRNEANNVISPDLGRNEVAGNMTKTMPNLSAILNDNSVANFQNSNGNGIAREQEYAESIPPNSHAQKRVDDQQDQSHIKTYREYLNNIPECMTQNNNLQCSPLDHIKLIYIKESNRLKMLPQSQWQKLLLLELEKWYIMKLRNQGAATASSNTQQFQSQVPNQQNHHYLQHLAMLQTTFEGPRQPYVPNQHDKQMRVSKANEKTQKTPGHTQHTSEMIASHNNIRSPTHAISQQPNPPSPTISSLMYPLLPPTNYPQNRGQVEQRKNPRMDMQNKNQGSQVTNYPNSSWIQAYKH